MYIKNNMMDNLRAQLMEDKTLQVIRANAIIEKVDPSQLAQENAPAEPEKPVATKARRVRYDPDTICNRANQPGRTLL